MDQHLLEKKRNKLEWQRNRRKETDNATTKKYEKTKGGFLMRLYRNMQSRVCGIQIKKYHLYSGCDLLSRDDFYAWANESKQFHALFKEWEESAYDRKKTPSVDRIDSAKGYCIKNMEWVTHSENSRRGSVSRRRKKRE